MKNKRIFLCGVFLIMIFLTTGCSTVGEKEIKKDIENYELFSNLNVDVLEFEIIKRQTNKNEKTDKVYVSVSGENEHYSVVRNYVLEYQQYNEGWMLENIEAYDNEDKMDTTKPLHGVSYEQAFAYEKELDYEQHASIQDEIKEIQVANKGQPSTQEYVDINEDGTCAWEKKVSFIYYTFYEEISIPIVYSFYGEDGIEGSYGWHPTINISGISRKMGLTPNIVGLWGSNDNWFSLAGRLKITSYSEEECYAENFYVEGAGETEYVSGKLKLEYSEREEDGTLYYPHLVWEDENNPYSFGYSITLDSYRENTIEIGSFSWNGYWDKIG